MSERVSSKELKIYNWTYCCIGICQNILLKSIYSESAKKTVKITHTFYFFNLTLTFN